MNDADSKKLEEIEGRWPNAKGEMVWLISKIKEQDREIERLRELAFYSIDESGSVYSYRDFYEYQKQHPKKAEAELADCKERVRGLEETLERIKAQPYRVV